jgi:tRNA(fMet)-specific endonuclease VapC
VILDTSVLVASERADSGLGGVLDDEDEPAIAAITAAELLVGVELASAARRERRARRVEGLLAAIPVEPYTVDVARAHAGLLAATRRAGRPRGAYDLIVAATAVATSRVVISADRAAFADLPGVAARIAA